MSAAVEFSTAAIDLKLPVARLRGAGADTDHAGRRAARRAGRGLRAAATAHGVQLILPLALAVLAALTMVVRIAAGSRLSTAGIAMAVDGPALFLQGTILVLAAMALLLIGERSVERGGAFVAHAAVTAESAERPAAGRAARRGHRGVPAGACSRSAAC